jgi:hypothetical protein
MVLGAGVSRVVLVHGIGQQYSGEESVLADWLPGLLDGLKRAGAPWRAGGGDVAAAFYGDLFRPPGRPLGAGDPLYTAEDVAPGMEEDLLRAWWAGAAAADPGVAGPDARTLARAPGSVQAGLRNAEANDLLSRNVATLAGTPKGQEGRRKSELRIPKSSSAQKDQLCARAAGSRGGPRPPRPVNSAQPTTGGRTRPRRSRSSPSCPAPGRLRPPRRNLYFRIPGPKFPALRAVGFPSTAIQAPGDTWRGPQDSRLRYGQGSGHNPEAQRYDALVQLAVQHLDGNPLADWLRPR